MLRIKALFIYLLVLSVPAVAQRHYGSDSLSFYRQTNQQIVFAFKDAALLQALTDTAYGQVDLQFHSVSGNFRRAQEAYRISSAGLHTSGFNTLGRFKIGADFLFSNTREDSLAYTLKGPDEDMKPYYFFAGKNGPYQRQNYQVHTLGSYELWQDKLYINAGLDYQTLWTTRSVDPRPDVKFFQLRVSPGISYRFRSQYISAGIIWGYGNEDNHVRYKNSNFEKSTLYPDRITYINHGYGYIVLKDTAFIRRYDRYKGVQLAYSGMLGPWALQTSIRGIYASEENTQDTKYRRNYNLRSRFEWSDYAIAFLAGKKLLNEAQQLFLQINIRQGEDWNPAFRGHNYFTHQYNASVAYNKQVKRHTRWQPEFGIHANYQNRFWDDRVSAHSLSQVYLQPGLRLAVYHLNPNADRLSLALEPAYRFPLHTELSVPPTQENVFSRGVVYPDYYYFSSSALQLNTDIQYITRRLLKQYATGIKAGVIYMRQTSRSQEVFPAVLVSDGNRLLLNISVNLYL